MDRSLRRRRTVASAATAECLAGDCPASNRLAHGCPLVLPRRKTSSMCIKPEEDTMTTVTKSIEPKVGRPGRPSRRQPARRAQATRARSSVPVDPMQRARTTACAGKRRRRASSPQQRRDHSSIGTRSRGNNAGSGCAMGVDDSDRYPTLCARSAVERHAGSGESHGERPRRRGDGSRAGLLKHDTVYGPITGTVVVDE